MIEDSDLFLALAEIAGVFVGFGALIGFSRGGRVDPIESSRIRVVVAIGLAVVVAALLPVALARYEMGAGHLWPISSATFLVLIWVAILVPLQDPLHRGPFLAQVRASPVVSALWLGLGISIQVPLVLVLLGMYPALFAAHYTTALVINLFEAALLLVQLVYTHRDPIA